MKTERHKTRLYTNITERKRDKAKDSEYQYQ